MTSLQLVLMIAQHAVVCVPPCRGVSMYRTRDLVDQALKGIPEKYRVEIWVVYTGT